jgi:DNA-binding response OmpR family regulator
MQSDGHVVLIAEDDEGIRSLVVDFLRDEQIHAEEARDGAEALGLVEAYRPYRADPLGSHEPVPP